MFKKTLTLMGLTFSLSTNAAIVDLGNITRDSDTGLEWLDVTETVGLPYYDVVAQMGQGGAYEGWRHATYQELDSLVLNFGYVPQGNSCRWGNLICDILPYEDNNAILQFISILGDTEDIWLNATNGPYYPVEPGRGGTRGILAPTFANNNPGFYWERARITNNQYLMRDTLELLEVNPDVYTLMPYSGGPIENYTLDAFGHFLVRPSEVPIPATAWLFGSALIGLVGMGRNRKQV